MAAPALAARRSRPSDFLQRRIVHERCVPAAHQRLAGRRRPGGRPRDRAVRRLRLQLLCSSELHQLLSHLLRHVRSVLLQGELVAEALQSLPSQVRLLRTVLRAVLRPQVLPDAVLRPQVLPDAMLRPQVLPDAVLRFVLRSVLLQGELVEEALQSLPSQVRLLRYLLRSVLRSRLRLRFGLLR